MRREAVTGLFGGVILALASFFVGQATTRGPSEMDGNPVGFHLAGSVKMQVSQAINLSTCTPGTACQLTFDFHFWNGSSGQAAAAVCATKNCLMAADTSGGVNAVVTYGDGWQLNRTDLNTNVAVSAP